MKDSIREINEIPELTMGLDLGDKFSYYCIIDKSGQNVEEGRVKTQRRAMERFFKSQPKMRVVLETGTHSRWVQAIAKEQGHEEIVANPRQVRLISQNRKKSDRKDGELLGRLGRVDPELLYPIQQLCQQKYPDTENIQQVRGVGPITALAYVLTLEDAHRFGRSRQVGAYLGLTPRQDQSGNRDPQLRITKAGDRFVRKLLVGSSQYILGPVISSSRVRR